MGDGGWLGSHPTPCLRSYSHPTLEGGGGNKWPGSFFLWVPSTKILGSHLAELDVHHKDNDGLNNRRRNLEAMTHKRNMREGAAPRDWEAWDREKAEEAARVEVFKKAVRIGLEVAEEFGLVRQQLWLIRNSVMPKSKAAQRFWDRVRLEAPEILEGFEGPPHLALRRFISPKRISQRGA